MMLKRGVIGLVVPEKRCPRIELSSANCTPPESLRSNLRGSCAKMNLARKFKCRITVKSTLSVGKPRGART